VGGSCSAAQMQASDSAARSMPTSSAVISNTVKVLDVIGRREHADLQVRRLRRGSDRPAAEPVPRAARGERGCSSCRLGVHCPEE